MVTRRHRAPSTFEPTGQAIPAVKLTAGTARLLRSVSVWAFWQHRAPHNSTTTSLHSYHLTYGRSETVVTSYHVLLVQPTWTSWSLLTSTVGRGSNSRVP